VIVVVLTVMAVPAPQVADPTVPELIVRHWPLEPPVTGVVFMVTVVCAEAVTVCG
jgi:hypothetical protein